ncbi:porin family protein [Parabacteroides sp. Marseille-P3160]|uniref:porin family protein n=1 Tax=Parabacteroides sp. Marseille-P3160 TaxID=1917887 RepID=UPI0009BAE138|nr:porin family protein [Parabacteroides sp. Marseille-P3160]
MKKIIFLIVSFLWVPAVIHAQQDTFRPELAIGPSFGVNYTTVLFMPKVDTKMKQGFTGGVTFRLKTEKNLGLQAEINYSQEGWEETFDDPRYSFSRTLSYIEVPFMTHIHFGGKRSRFFINLGPMVGFYWGGNSKSQLEGYETNRPTEQHSMDVQNKIQWGLGGGPGYELHTGIGSFILEVRYYYLLGDIYKTRKEDVFSQASGQVFSAKIAYLIPFLK